jgi:hypothetical protein
MSIGLERVSALTCLFGTGRTLPDGRGIRQPGTFWHMAIAAITWCRLLWEFTVEPWISVL